MTKTVHVRGHRRADGTYVRAHTRKVNGGTATGGCPATASSGPMTVPVRSHTRTDGTYVRAHTRQISGTTVAAAGGGGGAALLILLLLFGGGSHASGSTGQNPSPAPTSTAHGVRGGAAQTP
ncbi:hypothetical protein [Kitasatospora sp. LaBMicrA B282]|uniref:hypothetical protein n=1 Tax=Kitasatospora sp. LaBMicrA B282 TaxID=3420949 RepID=UPI003D0BBDAA